MTPECQTCIGLNCHSLVDDDNLYSLDRIIFPFILTCPPGNDCSLVTEIRFICCNETIIVRFPTGASDAQKQELLQKAVNDCAIANGFCGEDDRPDGNEPPPPPNEQHRLIIFLSRSQRVERECPDGGTFFFELRAGAFAIQLLDTASLAERAAAQQNVDNRARDFAAAEAQLRQFCLRVPPICPCTDEESLWDMVIVGGGPPFSFTVVGGHVPAGMALSLVGRTLSLSGTPVTPGAYSFNVLISNGSTGYLIKTVQLNVINIGYGATITTGFTAPSLAATVVTTLSASGFIVGTVLRASKVSAGVTTGEYGEFEVTALDTPGPGQTTLTNTSSPPGTLFVIGDAMFWDLEDVPDFTASVPYSFQLPAVGGTGYFWTLDGDLPVGLSMSDSGLISGTPSGSPGIDPVVSLHSTDCETLPPPTAGKIYWGILSNSSFGPGDFNSWSESKLSNFFSLLERETGPYRTTGYHVLNPFGTNQGIAWFVVPDSYFNPATGTGMKWAIGNAVSPTDEVMTQVESAVPDLDENQIANAYSPDFSANGWYYFKRVFAGVTYRFYAFGTYISVTQNVLTGWTFRSRTSNVATVQRVATTWQVGVPNSKFFNFSDPSFNEYFVPVNIGFPDMSLVTYANVGPDSAPVADPTGTWAIWTRGVTLWNNFLGQNTFTLFIEV